jgi:hypothetical protein
LPTFFTTHWVASEVAAALTGPKVTVKGERAPSPEGPSVGPASPPELLPEFDPVPEEPPELEPAPELLPELDPAPELLSVLPSGPGDMLPDELLPQPCVVATIATANAIQPRRFFMEAYADTRLLALQRAGVLVARGDPPSRLRTVARLADLPLTD